MGIFHQLFRHLACANNTFFIPLIYQVMSRARRPNRQRVSELGVPARPAAGPAPQAIPAPQVGPAPQAAPVPQAGPVFSPAAAAPIPAVAVGALPGGALPENQAPAQGANDQEAQRLAREALLRLQLQHPQVPVPVGAVELDKRLVIDGMRRVKDLRDGDYEDWILKVQDALLQAGMHAMFNLTSVARDELADAADQNACATYPVGFEYRLVGNSLITSLKQSGPS